MKGAGMGLSIPKYIEEEKEIGAPLIYEWDDESHRAYWAREVPALENKVGKISARSCVVFSAGIGEWVAWRLSKHSNDRSLLDCTEAVYASAVDWSYFNPPTNPLKWRKGSVYGPMDVARYLLIKIIRRASGDEDIADLAVCLSNLVEHLLPDSRKPFRKWRDQVLIRLRKFEPLDLNEPDGNPVSRGVLDPDLEFKPEMSAKLLAMYLKGLDYKKNPYLSPPEKMMKAGFEGIPYQL
jgi:hypothetical protein